VVVGAELFEGPVGDVLTAVGAVFGVGVEGETLSAAAGMPAHLGVVTRDEPFHILLQRCDGVGVHRRVTTRDDAKGLRQSGMVSFFWSTQGLRPGLFSAAPSGLMFAEGEGFVRLLRIVIPTGGENLLFAGAWRNSRFLTRAWRPVRNDKGYLAPGSE
jgi:hypothetical protein